MMANLSITKYIYSLSLSDYNHRDIKSCNRHKYLNANFKLKNGSNIEQ